MLIAEPRHRDLTIVDVERDRSRVLRPVAGLPAWQAPAPRRTGGRAQRRLPRTRGRPARDRHAIVPAARHERIRVRDAGQQHMLARARLEADLAHVAAGGRTARIRRAARVQHDDAAGGVLAEIDVERSDTRGNGDRADRTAVGRHQPEAGRRGVIGAPHDAPVVGAQAGTAVGRRGREDGVARRTCGPGEERVGERARSCAHEGERRERAREQHARRWR